MTMLRRFRHRNPELHRRDTAPHYPFPPDAGADREGIERPRNHRRVRARIRKRTQYHVSGQAGERIDITNVHGSFSLTSQAKYCRSTLDMAIGKR